MSMQSVPEWAFQVPSSLASDIKALGIGLQRFKAGDCSEAQFRTLRVPMGVYEQRESGTYFLRVRFPAGGLLPAQMRCLAESSKALGNGTLHVTTRQDIQVHRVSLESIVPVMEALAEAGLSSKGGGGNTVRNITSCCDAGACREEVFDVAPYSVAVTERLLEDSASFELPRKYKVAFSGCSADCAGATVNDVGFIARQKNGIQGFAVYVAGGMGNKSRTSELLYEFVEASEAYWVAESIKRVFDKHGNRKDKNKARLRFLLQSLGFEKFRDLCALELAALRVSAPEALCLRPFPQPMGKADHRGPQPPIADPAAFQKWRESNVQPQKQAGLFRVDIPLPLGDINSATMHALADVVAERGDGLLWVTQAQNLALRALCESELPSAYSELNRLGLASAQPALLRNLVACAGASMCRLGICQSRGLAKSLSTGLLNSNLDLEKAGNVRIHISGCPNSCGRHLVADIGLHGAARRTASGLVPHYVVSLGGKTQEGQTRFGSECGTIPAKNVPNFIVDLVRHWALVGDDSTLREYLGHPGHAAAKDLARVYREPPALYGDKNYHSDWDCDEPFSLAGRGAGECGAGVFDLIEVDLARAFESLKVGELYAATVAAARSLLVTRGEQPKTDIESLSLFQKHFIAGGLVDRAFDKLIETAVLNAADPSRFAPPPPEVSALVSTVRSLYDSMDASLRFEPVLPQNNQPHLQLD